MEHKPNLAALRRVSIVFAVLGSLAIVIPILNGFVIFDMVMNQFNRANEMSSLAYSAWVIRTWSLVAGLIVEALTFWFAGSIFLAKARYEWQYRDFLAQGGDRRNWPRRLLSGR